MTIFKGHRDRLSGFFTRQLFWPVHTFPLRYQTLCFNVHAAEKENKISHELILMLVS